MSRLLETIITSLQEIVGSGIKILPGLLTALIIILLTRYAAEFVQQIAHKLGNKTIKSHSLQLLLSKTSYVSTWVIGALFAAVIAFPGLELGDIIATLGLSSVAVGFAFQDIFKNFLAGVLLLLQEPFRINDQVIIGEYEGTVERIDIRTTQIRTYTGEQVLLPNATVFTSAVQVRTAFESRRSDLGVGVDYNTSLPEATKILLQTIKDIEGVLHSPPPEVDIESFGDSSIDLVVRYWTLPQKTEVRRTQTKAIVAIKKAFDLVNINIPYPIRTVYHYDQQQFNDYLPVNGNGNTTQN
ncbi:MAG: mechanosensitive ion channel family protein [Symploca sp. SIO2E9]|nr:mechanosensitive ion channel family protein [Symploca sp. SIO2E9]